MWIISCFTSVFRDSATHWMPGTAPPAPKLFLLPFPCPAGPDSLSPSKPGVALGLAGPCWWQCRDQHRAGLEPPARGREGLGHSAHGSLNARAKTSPRGKPRGTVGWQRCSCRHSLPWHQQHCQDLQLFSEMLKRGQPSLDTNKDIPVNAVQDVFK